MSNTEPENSILLKMLDRLFAGVMSGPNLNCRPHSSRQRIDWTQFSRLLSDAPVDLLKELLSPRRGTQVTASGTPPSSLPKKFEKPSDSKKRRDSKSVASTTDSVASDATAEKKPDEEQLSPEERKQRDEWAAQQSLLTKLRGLAEDACDYEQDTGVHALHVGFPLLSLPPGTAGSLKGVGGSAKRLLAPIAFVPVSLTMRPGQQPTIVVNALYEGAEFLVPNEALFAWLERQTGKRLLPESSEILGVDAPSTAASGLQPAINPEDSASATDAAAPPELPTVEPQPVVPEAHDPWWEINDLVRRVAEVVQISAPCFSSESFLELQSAPRSDVENASAEIVSAAVLGLFPMNNQGLLRDMQAMVATERLEGPVLSFVSSKIRIDDLPSAAESVVETQSESSADSVDFDMESGVTAAESDLESTAPSPSERSNLSSQIAANEPPVGPRKRDVRTERMVTTTDPCQARAVRLACKSRGLVIHGPPGTGKSQTITNIIGDHLARGERVLLVCDKRTALDVVAQRLRHLGLGDLCALIHDPQHDQRDLYRQVREQLENLTDTKVNTRADSNLSKLDEELSKTLNAIQEAWSLVMDPDPKRGVSFHERMGEWLEAALPMLIEKAHQQRRAEQESVEGTEDDATTGRAEMTSGKTSKPRRKRAKAEQETVPQTAPVTAAMFEMHALDVRDILNRAVQIDYAKSPWRGIVGLSFEEFLLRPISTLRSELKDVLATSADADETCDDSIPPFVMPTADALSFQQQAILRERLAAQLDVCRQHADPKWIKRWAKTSEKKIEEAGHLLLALEPASSGLERPLDSELRLRMPVMPPLPDLLVDQHDLNAYLSVSKTWRRWFAFRTRRRANAVFRKYGLTPGIPEGERLAAFVQGLLARTIIVNALVELTPSKSQDWNDFDDESLSRDWETLQALLQTLVATQTEPALMGLREAVKTALAGDSEALIEGLQASTERAEVLTDFREQLHELRLFRSDWLQRVTERLCRNDSLTVELEQLIDGLSDVEAVLRIDASLAELPVPLASIVAESMLKTVHPATVDEDEDHLAEAALNTVKERVLSEDIKQWLAADRRLQLIDGAQLTNRFEAAMKLERQKHEHVQASILSLWIGRQRERLLASTGSRLSGLGADLRRRLTMRGERALRLRQVISVGSRIDGGDPLFDLRPVWMASPETVAQIFPREALFDVVIFDEASQCRLEEALPVLTRAKRVVVAGDPKQLPPTRFFESASVANSDTTEIETDEQLFEVQQSDVEDLLSAALLLDIQQSYLDVHYRSRNSALIEFSNEQFYGSRLQAIPGHPRNRIRFAPISLYAAKGIYHERTNVAEAEQVGRIVADLLKRFDPPSIGIACFNVTQRDLILDKLAELANDDEDFATRLATARSRQGKGAFEGLFVKNLENVQGDERDHIIISTTYGPDPEGRFYRRFGPLGQVGGGRRLNVLITRAREEVHLVTSIPSDCYRNLPEIPAGQQPGGGWLLFSYLAYAERLSDRYAKWRSEPEADMEPGGLTVNVLKSRAPSRFAEQFALLMAHGYGVGSDVHWGNDGFCVDVALHHPDRPDDRTLGIVCDGSRFENVEDPVEWDVFRTAVLADQSWSLFRIWSPQLFRDLDRHIQLALAEAGRIAKSDPDPDSIPVGQ